MLRQYRAWLASDGSHSVHEQGEFYAKASVVLDTNVLLDLYRYTPSARDQVFSALKLVSERLWLPHQVGLEFVRGRSAVIDNRVQTLQRAKQEIQRCLDQAWQDVARARDYVKTLLQTYGADEAGRAELDELIKQPEFYQMLSSWKEALGTRVQKLKDDQDLETGDLASGADSILPKIAALFGDRIAAPPSARDVRRRVEWATQFRYPNQIPPGFLDIGKAEKGTDLLAAGDLLIWEELVEHARELPKPRRVIFVSGDVKGDWYQPASAANRERPWPALLDEFRGRAGTDLLIVQTQDFFEGVREHLDAEIAESTVDEISRTADSSDVLEAEAGRLEIVTGKEAMLVPPPERLSLAAYRAAMLSTSVIRASLGDPSQRMFQWWLVGVTEELGLRERLDDEPLVDLEAAVRSDLPPNPDWHPGAVLPQGEWPLRRTSWVAPWLVRVVKATPAADRRSLLRLAVRQINARFEQRQDEDPGDIG